MSTPRAILLSVALVASGSCGADGLISVWPERPPPPLQVGLRPAEADQGSTDVAPVSALREALVPQVRPAEAEPIPPFEPERAWILREAAKAIPPPLTLAEQGGADVDYCPGFLPDLYPERTLAQHCGNELFSSPFLVQGPAGRTFFQVASEEVEGMWESDRDLLLKSTLAGLYYWVHHRSGAALDGALRVFLAEESAAFSAVLFDAVVPPLLKVLPSELSGLPPEPGQGVSVDLRVSTTATYRSICDPEEVLRTAAARQLDGIAVTDMDHIEGVRRVEAIAARLKREGVLPSDFLVIPGQEVSTLSGPLLALFVDDRIQRGMTIKAAIEDIHRQGGVAILADPGTGSGTKLVETMDVDGYLLRTQPDSAFRTLLLMEELAALDKPLLTASGTRCSSGVGLPHSVVETSDHSLEGVRRALKAGSAYGATNIHTPIFGALVFRPLVPYEKALASWFAMRQKVETQAARLIGSDNVEVRTSYDEELSGLLGLIHAPAAIGRLIGGDSPLQRLPQLARVSADYSYVRIEYRSRKRTWLVMGAVRW